MDAFVSSYYLYVSVWHGLQLQLRTIAIATAIAGLGVSIAGIVLSNTDSDKFSGKGMSVAGMIIGSIMCGILLIAALLFFFLR